jgi:hypothetical protein
MMSYKKFSLFLLLSAGLLVAGTAAAWTAPTGAPPNNGNVFPPLNTSSSNQVKAHAADGSTGWITAGSFIAPNVTANTGVFSATSLSSGSFSTDQLTLQSDSGAITAATASNFVGGIDFDSDDTNLSVPVTVASIRALAGATHTATSLPTDLVFYTTPTNSLVPLLRMRIDSQGNVGIGASPSAGYTLDVSATANPDGSTNGGGDIRATAFVYRSDERLKTNIQTLGDALQKVLAMRGVSFVWKDGTPLAGKEDIGVIAQEVEKVAPEAVVTDSQGYKAVDYPRLVPILINAIHEQQAEIDSLKARLDKAGL